ncbi:hypothetical protein FRC11_007416 [Ceratobasidium sp. 423]|nr:hypothetical protein FRC11_007416 [Ceratobasidium sp. 423]
MSNNSHLPPTLPPVFLEPPRPRVKHRKGLMAMSDAEVWDFSDHEILDAAQSTYHSTWYGHYTPRLERHFDHQESYLETPIVPAYVLRRYGGVIPYWNAQLERRPRLTRMALDYLTAPASSVDAERAFSGGRLMINHLQHQMSSRTFQAQMAVGSWFGTPLLPNLSHVASIVEKNM